MQRSLDVLVPCAMESHKKILNNRQQNKIVKNIHCSSSIENGMQEETQTGYNDRRP